MDAQLSVRQVRLRTMPDDAMVLPEDNADQCVACRMNQPHLFGAHRRSIALYMTWVKPGGPWRDPKSEAVRRDVDDYVARLITGEVVLSERP